MTRVPLFLYQGGIMGFLTEKQKRQIKRDFRENYGKPEVIVVHPYFYKKLIKEEKKAQKELNKKYGT